MPSLKDKLDAQSEVVEVIVEKKKKAKKAVK